MKKILAISLLLASCKKIDYIPAPAPPQAIVGKINLSPIPSTGKVNMLIVVEPNVKYNITVKSFNGKIVKSLGISSVNSTIDKVEDFSNLENGIYDLILIDIKGNEIKSPFIIKH
jgi:hypothetical protein